MYNVHNHYFHGILDVPKNLFGWQVIPILAKQGNWQLVEFILHNMKPFSDGDKYDRMIQFVETGKLGSQEKVFLNQFQYWPDDTQFIALPMLMHEMGAGKVPRSYEDQIKELYNLSLKYSKNIIPFIMVDYRYPDMQKIFDRAIGEWKFKGIKMYLPLGTFPYAKEYDYYFKPEFDNLSIISHCTAGNPIHYKDSIKKLKKLLSDNSNEPLELHGKSRQELCDLFTHPSNWESRLIENPYKNIDLAHLGGADYWFSYLKEPKNPYNWLYIILKMMDVYDNLYGDVSFTLYIPELFPLLKYLLITNKRFRVHCLMGSDYYMNLTETTERQWGLTLRSYLGEELWEQISEINPRRFLKVA